MDWCGGFHRASLQVGDPIRKARGEVDIIRTFSLKSEGPRCDCGDECVK